jgi:hypothetical protein
MPSILEPRSVVLRRVLRDAVLLTAEEKARLVSSLQERMRDIAEVVPAGQTATQLQPIVERHCAPGVVAGKA